MKSLKALFAIIMVLSISAGIAVAQPGLEAYGIPKSDFPTPANKENASSIVNYNLDYMGMLSGKHLVHVDRQSGIRMYARVNRSTGKYTLFARSREGQEVPVRVDVAAENRNCLFAKVGSWINVLCSKELTYVPYDAEKERRRVNRLKKKAAKSGKKPALKYPKSSTRKGARFEPIPEKDR